MYAPTTDALLCFRWSSLGPDAGGVRALISRDTGIGGVRDGLGAAMRVGRQRLRSGVGKPRERGLESLALETWRLGDTGDTGLE